ncbi:MAG: hypothetical protein E3J83_03535 [Candidatus Atribacteria bacterium]|nr:MAG: hypothetical protein E3J83_03535 [Candidatus Atribacteria bacterium]
MKYPGSWAKGFAGGLPQGFGMGQQILEWKERKAAQKKIDDAAAEFKTNSMELARKFDLARANGDISVQEYSDGIAWAIPLGHEITDRLEKIYTNFRNMTSEQINMELDNIDAFWNLSKDLDFSNIPAMKAFGSNLTNEKAKIQWQSRINMAESYKTKQEQRGRLGIAVTGAGVGSEAAYVEMNKLLGTNYKPEDITEEIGKTLNKANVTLANAAALGKSAFNTVLNNMKLDPQYKEININFENISYEQFTAKEPAKPADLREVDFSVQRIKDASSSKEAQTLANAYIEEHGSLKGLGIEGTDVGQYWGENQRYLLDNIARDLATLVNEKGFVRPEEMTERNLFGVRQTMSNKEWFQILAGEYEPLWDKLKALGVDMTNIPKIKKLKDISKIEKLTLIGGTKKGDWRPDGWWF